MIRQTIIVGGLLGLLGLVPYSLLLATGNEASVTALIPAFFGIPILAVGLLGLRLAFQRTALSIAMVVALLGFVLPAARLLSVLGNVGEVGPLALFSLVMMTVLCGGLLVVGRRSYVGWRPGKGGKQSLGRHSGQHP